MAQSIGQVIFISGNAKAVDASGNERILEINSMVYMGETIITEGSDSRVLLKMDNNQTITLGRNDRLTLDQDIYDPNSLPAEEAIASVEDIQQALLNDPDFDPAELEATAAGGATGVGDSTAEPIIITHNQRSVSFSFLETEGISNGLGQGDDFIDGNNVTVPLYVADISLSGVSVVNEGDTANYTLTLSNAPLNLLRVEITISHITTDENDLHAQVVYVDVPAGSSSVTFSVDTIDSLLAEPDETFKVEITGTGGGGYDQLNIINSSQTTTILDETSPGNPDPEDVVTIQLIALDENGNEVAANEALEGNVAHYIAVMEDADGNRVNANGTVEVTFSNGTAIGGDDFDNTTQTVTLGVPFSAQIIDDYIADNAETFTAQITDNSYSNASDYESVAYNLTPVTTTIIDDAQPNTPNDPTDGVEPDLDSVTLKLVALDENGNEVTSNTGIEGESTAYMVVLEDPDGNRINTATGNVSVSFSNGTATGGDDFNATTQTVALGTAFSTDILDDYIADNGETFNVQIVDNSYSNASAYETVVHDATPVTTTIIDDSQPNTPNDPTDGVEPDLDSVTLKLIALDENGNEVAANTGIEGESTAYMVVLEDPNGNRINTATGNVDVSFSNGTATGGDDFNATTQTVALGTAFSTDILDDYIADNGETFNVQIVDNSYSNASAYETVVHDTTPVTTTIIDDSQANTPNDPTDGIEPDTESVIIRLVAAENGSPIVDNNGHYVMVNEVPEGDAAQFMALAFKPGTTEFNAANLTDQQLGSVDLTFSDQTATGSNSAALDVTPDHAYLNAGESAYDFTTEFTISVDVTATGNGGIIFNKENVYEIAQEADGSIRYALRASDGSGWVWNDTGYDLPNNESHNLTFVYDGSSNTVTLYEDGVQVALSSQNVPSQLDSNNRDLLFGERGNGNQPFEGQFDNIRIFNTALDATEVATIDQVSNGLVSYYNFDGSNPLEDKSGNGNDATLANGASIATIPVDYDNSPQNSIALGTVISTAVLDDYMADNGETFTAQITDGSYQPPAGGGGYETVEIITDPVTTTITDNSLPGTPNNPVDDNIEADRETIIIKLVAAENGAPVVDGNGDFVLLNTVGEGASAQYIAYAFEPGTTSFNASTLLDQQVGSVDVQLADVTATGVQAALDNHLDVTANHASLNAGEAAYDFTDAFTISVDVMFSGNGGIIFNKENAYEIAVESDGSVRYALRASDGSGWVWNDTGYDLPANENHNITFSFDGNSNIVTLYDNGTQVFSGSQNVPNVLTTNNRDLLFGERGNNNQGLEGQLDNIRIYNTTLSAAEVNDIVNGINVTNGLVAHYDFDGSNPLADKSGNGNDAVLQNGAVLHSNVQLSIDGSEDYDSTTQQNIPLGQVFDVRTFDDYRVENSEQFNVQIIDNSYQQTGSGSYETVDIDTGAVTTTIVDNGQDQVPDQPVDTVYAIIEGDSGVIEGQSADYLVRLVDINGDTVTAGNNTQVIVRYNNVTTQDGDTQYSNGQTISLTIAAGSSSTGFSLQTLNDQPIDSGEQYSLTITSVQNTGEFENTAPGTPAQIMTEITDINDAPVADNDSASATETGNASYAGSGSDLDIGINATGNVLLNDSDIDTPHSQLSVSDIQSNDTANTPVNIVNGMEIVGQYGTLTISNDGSFTYVINDSNTDVNALNTGDTLQESFTYTVSDNEANALTDTAILNITINGTNDAPEASADTAPVMTELDNNQGSDTPDNNVTGNVLLNDTDVDNALSDLSVVSIAHGINVNMSGGNDQALVMSEAGGAPDLLGGAGRVDMTLVFSSSDDGSNGALVSYASSGFNNDFLLFMSGNNLNLYIGSENVATGITRAELFDGDTHTLRTQWDGNTGQASFYLDGQLEGTANIGQGHTLGQNGTMMLAQEQDSVGGNLDANQSLSAVYHSLQINTDVGGGSQALWNFNELNGSQINDVNGNYTLSVDNNITHSQGTTSANSEPVNMAETPAPVSINGAYGVISIAADGSYSYELYDNNPAVDALNIGDSLEEVFTYTMTDNASGNAKYDTSRLTITINGSNDAPIVSNDTATAYEEGIGHAQYGQQEDAIQAQGNLLANDLDVDSSLSVTQFNGQNIAPGGSITITTTYGEIQVFSNGNYIYTANESNAAVDSLNTGDSLQEAFNYTASDGAKTDNGQLNITIEGRDDRPEAFDNTNVITELADDTNSINEVSGNLITEPQADTDVDNPVSDLFIAESQNQGVAINMSGGNNQGLIYDERGNQALLSGASRVDVSIRLSSTETGSAAILSYASNEGHNDFLLFVSGNSLNLYVGNQQVATGISRADIFDGNIHDLRVNWDSATGNAEIYLDGALNNTINIASGHTLGTGVLMLAQEQDAIGGNLDANQTLSTTIYDLGINTDINTAQWDMNSINTGAISDTTGQYDLLIDNNVVHSQNSNNTQPNSQDVHIVSDFNQITDGTVINLNYGTLTLNADGSYRYELDDANPVVQALATGETLQDTYTYTLSDGQKVDNADLTITITGSNDAPVLDLDQSSAGTGYETTYTENTAAIAITDSDIQITDVDDSHIESARIVFKNYNANEDQINTTAVPSGFTITETTSGNDLVIELTGTATLSEYQNAIHAISYENTSELPDESRLIELEISVNDGEADSNTALTTIHLNAAPDPVADTANVVEGQNTVSGNVLSNDTDQGTPSATVHQFTYTDENGNLLTVSAGTVVDTQFGHNFTINTDGSWSYTSDQSEYHRDGSGVEQNTLIDSIQYNLIDANGDISDFTTLDVSVTDTVPDIGTPVDSLVDEDDLITDINGNTQQPTVSATLDIIPGADDYTLAFNGTSSLPANLTSNGQAIVYQLNSTEDTIIAYLDGTDSSIEANQVFVVTLDKNTSSYTFTLKKPVDHTTNGQTEDFNFDFKVIDSDGDAVNSSFIITINDSLPLSGEHTVTTNEDQNKEIFLADENALITIGGHDLANAGDKVNLGQNGNVLPDGDPAIIAVVTRTSSGSLEFAPANNYSGELRFEYSITDVDGDTANGGVTVVVTPVADAPQMAADINIDVYEDNSYDPDTGQYQFNDEGSYEVALGLSVPVITDNIDLNGSAANDSPERLGLISLNIQNAQGAQLVAGATTYALASENATVQFYITDIPDYHYNGIDTTPANVIKLTQAEYQAMRIIPREDDAQDDIVISVRAQSHEVDDNGDRYSPDIVSPVQEQRVTVNVHAVTDPVSLTDNDGTPDGVLNVTIEEDSTLDLQALLSTSFGDNDGSENHYYDLSGLQPGTVIEVDGNSYTADGSGAINNMAFSGINPSINLTPPADWDGNSTITITLKAIDTDSAGQTDAVQPMTDSVQLNLVVTPVAGDVQITDPQTATEDTEVYLFRDSNGNLTITATDSSGSSQDIVSGVKILTSTLQGNISMDAGTPAPGIDGLYTVFDVDHLAGYKITPPANSSTDINMTVVVETTDGTSVVETTDANYTLQVTPVAERTDADTNNDGVPDVTINPDVVYSTAGNEDQWFDLTTDGTDLQSAWTNQDSSSEQTLVNFSAAAGSQFRYTTDNGANWIVQTVSSGSSIDIPLDYLHTVQFMAPAQSDGSFDITMRAKTIDTDEDNPAITNEQLSGEAHLTIQINPVADNVSVGVSKQIADEDTGRDALGNITNNGQDGVPLNIKVHSDDTDGSESYTLKIDQIPVGAAISYNGVLLSVVQGTQYVEIPNFDISAPMFFIPAHNSNDNLVMKLSAKAIDNGVEGSYGQAIDFEVDINGVADKAINNELNSITLDGKTYNAVSSEDQLIDLQSIYQINNPVNIISYDQDGSETLNIVISGLPDGFDVQGAVFMGGTGTDRRWIMDNNEIGNVQISAPAHYSGELGFKLDYVTTENDGSTRTDSQTIKVALTPEVESTLIAGDTIAEDLPVALAFDLANNGDTDEYVSAIWIDAGSVPAGVNLTDANDNPWAADSDGFIKLSGTDINNVYVHLPDNSDMPQTDPSISGGFDLNVRYEITDPSTDGNLTADVVMSADTQYSVTVQAVADKPVLDMTGNYTTFNVNGQDYIAVSSGTDNINVTFPFELKSVDLDGSESHDVYRLSGVPDGVTVVNGIYAGDIAGTDTGVWYLDASGSSSNGVSLQEVTFTIGPNTFDDNADLYAISITGTNIEQRGGDTAESDPYVLYLGHNDAVTPDVPVDTSAPVDQVPDGFVTPPVANNISTIEEAGVRVADLYTAQQVDNSEQLSVNIYGLPAGTMISNAVQESVNGQPVWVVLDPDNAVIQFPENMNDNNKGTALDNIVLNITSTAPSGASVNHQINAGNISITPVTDVPQLSEQIVYHDQDGNIVSEALEDGKYSINISLDTVDNALGNYASPVSSNVEITLDSGSGELTDANGNPYPQTGNTWTVPLADISSMVFVPTADYSGHVALSYAVTMQETGAANTETVTRSINFDVQPVVDGYDLPQGVTELIASGSEDQFIELNTPLVPGDSDGSESALAVLINHVPEGMLVYIGDNHNTLAKNAGADGNGNTWSIDLNADGSLPKIWFKPQANWSGQVTAMTLSAVIADGAVSQEVNYPINLSVTAVADGITTFAPENTFGEEGQDIPILLNTMPVDMDGSETVTMTLQGLGSDAVFKQAGQYIDPASVQYDRATDTYTLTDININHINDLSFQQESFSGTVNVGLKTVEISNGDESAVSSHQFDVNITPPSAADETINGTAGNDVLVGLSGNDILNGLDGDDILYAGSGNDTMTGGTGADQFVSSADNDLIMDYNQSEGDVLVISDLLDSSDNYLLSHLEVEDDGSDKVKINVLDDSGQATGQSITLDNMSFSSLDTTDPLADLLTKVDINNDVV